MRPMSKFRLAFWCGALASVALIGAPRVARAQEMPLLSYTGERQSNGALPDGGLPHYPGVQSVEVVHADRAATGPTSWTYNHAPMLARWNGTFYLSYLSSPQDEHAAPCRTNFLTSQDGLKWSAPRELFPAFPDDDARVIMHQRTGFYLAPGGVFLATGFYGTVAGTDGPPFGDFGIGRVVRQIRRDGTLGPIYYLRVNPKRAHNVAPQFPLYSDAGDGEFKAACEALLADKIKTLQFWDEEQNRPELFADGAIAPGLEAISIYRRSPTQLTGIAKWGRVIESLDNGQSWHKAGALANLPTNGAKVWAQQLSNGQFALVCNPTSDNEHRWPLAIVTSDDGLHFDDLRALVTQVPPQRYAGRFKNPGPQYVRGLEEGSSPDGALWLTYSMNKEDIWVARVPVEK